MRSWEQARKKRLWFNSVLSVCLVDKRSLVLLGVYPLDKLELPGKRGPQLINCLYQVGLCGIFLGGATTGHLVLGGIK